MEPHSLEYRELNDFNNWILEIGNETITHGYSTDEDSDPDSIIVEVPSDLLINTTGNKIEALIQCTYPDFKTKFNQSEYLKDRAILATTNEIVDEINDYMLNVVPTIEKEYFSADTIIKMYIHL